jgi:N-acetylmuramoyl-L-alanine amidase
MRLVDFFLTINPFTRPGRKLAVCKGIVFHYVGVPGQKAIDVWKFFEKTCPVEKHYSSAHYIINLDGYIYHAVPDDEIAYHCGSEKADSVSGRIYTDWARKKYAYYATDPVKTSPNFCTLGIELCINSNGNFTEETLQSAVELAAKLLGDYKLSVDDIGTHNMVVGWKDCPLPWVNNPSLFDDFKDKVREKMGLLI